LVGAAILFALLAWLGLPGGSAWETTAFSVAGVSGLLAAFVAFFFRDPVRRRRPDDELVFAPADGRVVRIEEVEEPTFMGGPATRISIFLSIFNVHVQRAPVTGRVAHKSYKPGGFAAAWNARASEENEQASLGLQAGEHRVLVRQIAGLVARRVVTDPEEGEFVPQLSRIGLIRFGSRVDLFVPPNWEIACKKGDRTKGGRTVMARIPREDGGRP
jgi:phosphatidylserine decarboxylase